MSKKGNPEKYTVNEIISHVAGKCGLSKKQMKDVYDALIDVIREGVISGQRVPIGNLGKVYGHKKPATKAREGRNPLTRETITIPARPAHFTPKISFSKAFKEEVSKKLK